MITAVVVVIGVVAISIITGCVLAPFLVRGYIRFLNVLGVVIYQIANPKHQKIQNGTPHIHHVKNIQCFHSTSPTKNGIDKPIKQGTVSPNFENGGGNNLDCGSLNVAKQPIVQSAGNPVPEATHAPNISQEKDSGQTTSKQNPTKG